MKTLLTFFLAANFLFTSNPGHAGGDLAWELIDLQLSAYQAAELPPRLAHEGYSIDADTAYRVQRGWVQELVPVSEIMGYKSGLTSPGAAEAWGLSEPVAGVLPRGAQIQRLRHNVPLILPLDNYQQPMIEVELGFILSGDIRTRDVTLQELKSKVERVVPVLEMPDLAFDGGRPEGIDVIAANVGVRHIAVGQGALDVEQLNALNVSLSRNGEQIVAGQGADAMGDQWRALHWLVQQRLAYGWPIRKGQLFITGALGRMLPLEPGVYRAQFGEDVEMHLVAQKGTAD